MSEFRTVSYRCSQCREAFGDPEQHPEFETWEVLVVLHVVNYHDADFLGSINSVLIASYS